MLNKKHLGCKKEQGQKNHQLKALISARAKKFIPIYNMQLFVTNNSQGVFPTMIAWLFHPWPPFCMIPYKQKVAKGDKAMQSCLGKHPVNCL